jgi:hypothetical protein
MVRATKKRTTSKRVTPSGRATANRKNPLARVKPVDLDRFIGKLPDDRSAEEILADLYAMKYGRIRR